jgi:uncharacterized protein YegP (UPF0339 family)
MAAKKNPLVEKIAIYKDESGDWRWKAIAGNNKIVASAGEGLRNRMYARKVVSDLYPGVDIEWH